jgi:hypothetical protein
MLEVLDLDLLSKWVLLARHSVLSFLTSQIDLDHEGLTKQAVKKLRTVWLSYGKVQLALHKESREISESTTAYETKVT